MLRFSIAVFVTTVCLLLESGVSANTVITCGAHVHRLSCESGVINVENSFYGRDDSTTCAGGKPLEEVEDTSCSLVGALDLLKKRCNGKKWCELNANCFETDPCSNTFKYIKTSYTCIPANHLIVCEQSMVNLECDQGKVISIVGEDFGRRDHTTCAFRRDPVMVRKIDCTNPTTVAAEKCNGKERCSFRANRIVMDAACASTYMYLELAYVCLVPK